MRCLSPLVIVTAIILLGFGCSNKANTNDSDTSASPTAPVVVANTNTPPKETPAKIDTTTDTTPEPETKSDSLPDTGDLYDISDVAVEIDETWETYTNESLGFEFQTPTRGRYAPTWEVKFISDDDSKMVDGCYKDALVGSSERSPERLSVDGVEFCRSFSQEGAAGSQYVMQHVATKKGGTNILVTFTKQAYSAGMVDCNPIPESGLSVSSTTCVSFVESEFDSMVEQIVSTFKYTE